MNKFQRALQKLQYILNAYTQIYITVVVQSLRRVQIFVTHGRQHARLPCPSLSPGVCSNSCPLNQWCYLTISSSTTLFSFCLQSFLASGSFPMSQLFASGGQSIGASASVLPMNIQGWLNSFRMDWFNVLTVQGTLKSLLQHHGLKGIGVQSFFSHIHIWCTWLLEKPKLWLHRPLSAKWCLCFLICCLGLLHLSFQGARVF